MSGPDGPSDAELARRLQKRLSQIDFLNYEKRYNPRSTGNGTDSGSLNK
jgi:hypothetical protein